MDPKNYIEFSRPWYAGALHFPFNYITPGQLQRGAEDKVEVTRGGSHLGEEEVKQRVSVYRKGRFGNVYGPYSEKS